ncbi:extracellular triacylglycerol lipase precursor [Mycena amicta]|nr:extracellular triacylglycerol lipase precursor [Mycena amicta]
MFLTLILFAALATSTKGATIRLGQTTLTGRDIPLLGQEFFGGIPYAEPPLGEGRLRPPQLKTTLDVEKFDATEFGPACLQVGLSPDAISEDCLTINVLRPAGIPASARLPVMFWTYPGAFEEGQSSAYNASAIVGQSVLRGTPVIYVNFNYRVGPLGFPQGQEADNRGALNLGMKDELAALEWVQANIGLFGGDKTKVTVFGASAGAMMTSILFLNSPIARLARAAIFQSGSQASPPLFTPERREIDWQNFVAGVPSCASLVNSSTTFACLQNANSSELLAGFNASLAKATERVPWDPVLDGPGGLIPDLPSVLFKKGQFARLPFISGTNLDEGTLFTPTTLMTPQDLHDHIAQLFTPSVSPTRLQSSIDELFVLYPDDPSLGAPFGTGNETFGLSPEFKRGAAMLTDLDFLALRRAWAQVASAAGVPTYAYLFTQPQPEDSPFLGVPHGAELFSVYGAPSDSSPASVALSHIMIDYWISFATSLTPNDGLGIRRPLWAKWTAAKPAVIQLNSANLTMIPDDFRLRQTNFINSDPAIWRH